MEVFISDVRRAVKKGRARVRQVFAEHEGRLDRGRMTHALADVLLGARGIHSSVYAAFDLQLSLHNEWIDKRVVLGSRSVAGVKRLFEEFSPFRKRVYQKFIQAFMRSKQRVKHLLPLDLIASLCLRPAHRLPATQCVKAAFPLLRMKLRLTPKRVLAAHWVSRLDHVTEETEDGVGRVRHGRVA